MSKLEKLTDRETAVLEMKDIQILLRTKLGLRRICVSNRTKVRHFTPEKKADRQSQLIDKFVKTLHVKVTDFYVSKGQLI